jgi:hypothetical protein
MQHIASARLVQIGDRVSWAGYIVLSSKRLDQVAREKSLSRSQAALQQQHITRPEHPRQGRCNFSGHRLGFGG